MIDDNADDDIIASSPNPILEADPDIPAATSDLDETEITDDPVEDLDDDDIAAIAAPAAVEDANDTGISYPEDKVDFRGESPTSLVNLVEAIEKKIGAKELDLRVKTIGSYENILFRAIDESSGEEHRIQEAIAAFSEEELNSLSFRLMSEGKTILRTSSLRDKIGKGQTATLSGEAAMLAFECNRKGGGYRIPLYNSGITIDVIVPTGNDVQTLLFNCNALDNQLGTSNGAHYFAYNDLMIKTQIVNFLHPLIINSSYSDWRKKNKLWSIIKLPDLMSIVAHLSALCYKDGFEGFVNKCTRMPTEENPEICGHTETLTANIFEMIVTRFAAMNAESIDFISKARLGDAKSSIAQVAKYQAGLGLEGERITFGNLTLTMRIPSVSEHMTAGSQFISDIINEIEGDNTEGRYEQFGFRYIRTFIPWIGSVELKGDDDETYITSDAAVIKRQLEKLDDNDPDGLVRERLRQYLNKVQFTYVGYPATPCPKCNHVADTPSGMLTFDPFNIFFTLAFLSLRAAV